MNWKAGRKANVYPDLNQASMIAAQWAIQGALSIESIMYEEAQSKR